MRRTTRGSSDPTDLAAIVAQVQALATRPDKTFFELGTALASLREHHPQAFVQVIAEAGISRRRAYYVLEVHERFAPFMAYEQRLRAIGWTKLTIIAPAVTTGNLEGMLALAQTTSAKRLAQIVAGATPTQELRCVLLYLTHQDYRRFASAMLKRGAQSRGRQLIGTEKALMAVIAGAEREPRDDN